MGAEAAVGAGDHGVGVAEADRERRDQGRAGAHQVARRGLGDAAALHELVIGAPVAVVARVVRGSISSASTPGRKRRPRPLGAPAHDLGAADQDRLGDALVEDDLGGAQHAIVLAGAEDHPLGVGARLLEHRPHDQSGLEDELVELLAVGLEVGDRPGGHAGVHGGLGDRGRQLDDQARVERLGNDLVRRRSRRRPARRRRAPRPRRAPCGRATPSARTQAIFISSLTVLAPTSSAPRKM